MSEATFLRKYPGLAREILLEPSPEERDELMRDAGLTAEMISSAAVMMKPGSESSVDFAEEERQSPLNDMTPLLDSLNQEGSIAEEKQGLLAGDLDRLSLSSSESDDMDCMLSVS